MTATPQHRISLHEALERLAALARAESAVEAYLVGGCVRDALLGRGLHDIDIAAAHAEAFAAAAADALDAHVVMIGGQFPLYRIPVAGGDIDVSPMQGQLAADLARRDFTVDALALALRDLPAGGLEAVGAASVIDHHHGLDDLQARRLRDVTPHALADDPLRAVRGARLACELGFDVDDDTRAQMRAVADSLDAVAPERVGAELLRLFACADASRGVRLLDETGLLGVCFPALDEGRDVEQRPWHLHTVRTHQLEAARWMDVLLARDAPEDAEARAVWEGLWRDAEWPATRWGAIRDILDDHTVALRIATLLHDVGKPATRTVEADGRTRFFGHPELGAELARTMLTHWRLSNEVVDRVTLLVGEHMRPGMVAAPGRPPTERALYRFHRALGDATADVCFLFLADSLATRGAAHLLPRWAVYVAHVQRTVLWRPAERAEEIRRLVDGHAVMRATGLAPGPALGRVLDGIHEQAVAGEIESVDEALEAAVQLAARETD
jgi:putative nucleotidyltransferase with HDIG domain